MNHDPFLNMTPEEKVTLYRLLFKVSANAGNAGEDWASDYDYRTIMHGANVVRSALWLQAEKEAQARMEPAIGVKHKFTGEMI